ncbi:unnamed protein product, partial [Staurois parvus]
MSTDTLITGKCNCRLAGIGTDHQGTDDQCPDDQYPAVPPTSAAHLCPAVHPPVPSNAHQCHPAVPHTCAQKCHLLVPRSATHLCPPVPPTSAHQCSPAVLPVSAQQLRQSM